MIKQDSHVTAIDDNVKETYTNIQHGCVQTRCSPRCSTDRWASSTTELQAAKLRAAAYRHKRKLCAAVFGVLIVTYVRDVSSDIALTSDSMLAASSLSPRFISTAPAAALLPRRPSRLTLSSRRPPPFQRVYRKLSSLNA